jgi:hypothetical protein
MKVNYPIASSTVTDHWPQMRDVLKELPPVTTEWFDANLEARDIDRLFVLSIGSFCSMSRDTLRLTSAIKHAKETFFVGKPFSGCDEARLRHILEYEKRHESYLVLVCTTLDGPFTILDGTHRSIIFGHENKLVGARVHVGCHPDMDKYGWHLMTHKFWSTGLARGPSK